MEVLSPSLEILKSTILSSKDGILITPFFSKAGLGVISEFFETAERCEFWTRLNIYDWQEGYADLPELCRSLKRITDRHGEVSLYVKSNLHSKIYFAQDCQRGLIGSANLTLDGFNSNLETMVHIAGDECIPLRTWLQEIRLSLSRIQLTDLVDAISITQDEIPPSATGKSTSELDQNEDFQAAVEIFEQELLKKIVIPEAAYVEPSEVDLKPGRSVIRPIRDGIIPAIPSPWPLIEQFIEFCEGEHTDSADIVIARYHGANNLSGHVKHFFYGALFFFFEYPNVINQIPDDLGERPSVEWIEEPWIGAWYTFLNDHNDDTFMEIGFSFRTLKVYLPPTCGGTTSGGGAGSGTFKRVLPLLKKQLKITGAIR